MSNLISNPIGLFDSGIGGYSIFIALKKVIPREKVIYVLDNKYSPYGYLKKSKLKERSIEIINFLISKKSKIIIIACNTVTTNLISFLRKKYSVPIVGVEPGVIPASLKTKSGIIGVLATKSTISSYLFKKTSKKIVKDVNIISKEGKDLIEIIENDKIEENSTLQVLKSLIDPMMKENADVLVLGCTHYPFLTDQIKKITKNKMSIIDTSESIAFQTKRSLKNEKLLSNSEENTSNLFFYTGNSPKNKILINEKLIKIKI